MIVGHAYRYNNTLGEEVLGLRAKLAEAMKWLVKLAAISV